MEAKLASLRALPGVGEAEASVKTAFAERLARMVRGFVETPPVAGEPAEMTPFREVLRAQAQ
jgi:hypothetical protein